VFLGEGAKGQRPQGRRRKDYGENGGLRGGGRLEWPQGVCWGRKCGRRGRDRDRGTGMGILWRKERRRWWSGPFVPFFGTFWLVFSRSLLGALYYHHLGDCSFSRDQIVLWLTLVSRIWWWSAKAQKRVNGFRLARLVAFGGAAGVSTGVSSLSRQATQLRLVFGARTMTASMDHLKTPAWATVDRPSRC
jgi:hypothetical protein